MALRPSCSGSAFSVFRPNLKTRMWSWDDFVRVFTGFCSERFWQSSFVFSVFSPKGLHAISTPFLWRGRGSEVRTFSDLFPKAPSPNFQAQFRTCVSRCYRVNTTGSSAAASTWTSSSLTTLVPTKCCSPAMVPDTKPHYAHGSPCCRRPFAKSCANHEELAVVLPSNAFSACKSCHLSERSESHA